MKKILLALALMLPTIVFTACEKEEENNGDDLVGVWMEDDNGYINYQVFNADRTCESWTESPDGEIWEEHDGEPERWSVSGNRLTFIDDNEDMGSYECTYSIENNLLTLYHEGSWTETYQRTNKQFP